MSTLCALALTSAVLGQARLVGLGDVEPAAFAARSATEWVVGDARGDLYLTRDGGLSWHTLEAQRPPASLPPTRRSSGVKGLTRGLAPGALAASLRDLWYFDDAESGIGFFDRSPNDDEVTKADPPSGFPEAGEVAFGQGFGARGRAQRRSAPRLAQAVSNVGSHSASLAGALEAVSAVESTPPQRLGFTPSGEVLVARDAGCERPGSGPVPCDEAVFVGEATPVAGCWLVALAEARLTLCGRVVTLAGGNAQLGRATGPTLQQALEAAERRFGGARRLALEAPSRSRAAAWVPQLGVVGGIASAELGATLAAAFLDDVTPFSSLGTPTHFGFGKGGEGLVNRDNIAFEKDQRLEFGYVLGVLRWDLGGSPRPPPPEWERADALREEVSALHRERERLLTQQPTPNLAAAHALRLEEVTALLDALTGDLYTNTR